jgi:hypothetical protein
MKATAVIVLTLALAGPGAAPSELTSTPLATGLKTPTKLVLTKGGNLLVSEAGDRGAAFVVNHGRVSLVDRHGDRRTLLDRLPSGVDLEGGTSGPTGLFVTDRFTLYLVIGVGDATRRGAPPLSPEIPNPAGPSSALMSSLWRVRFSVPIDEVGDAFALDPAADYAVLADGRELRIANASGDRARLRVLADLRDLYPGAPFPHVVSASNPFGVLLDEHNAYLADAGQNSVVKVDRESGRTLTIAHFPRLPNTLPFPGPLVDAVPNAIRRLSHGSALVPLFSGFPFGPGASSIQRVDLESGAFSSFIPGLTMAIDVLPLGGSKGPFLVLEYASRFQPPGPAGPPRFVPPGRLLRFARRDAPGRVVSTSLESPTSMAYDDCSGELFVVEIDTGRIVRLDLW